jgi:hypothetical protein
VGFSAVSDRTRWDRIDLAVRGDNFWQRKNKENTAVKGFKMRALDLFCFVLCSTHVFFLNVFISVFLIDF